MDNKLINLATFSEKRRPESESTPARADGAVAP